MHTFFINTSGKVLDQYGVLFDVCYENKTLISLNCDIRHWYEENAGFSRCVSEMGELIDTRGDLRNVFNLVVFIDLTSIKGYSSIGREDQKKRDSYLSVLYTLFIHMVKTTLIDKLREFDRLPQETLIMFGEDKRTVGSWKINADFAKAQMTNVLLEQLGVPDEAWLKETATSLRQQGEASEEEIRRFKDRAATECSDQTAFRAPDVYPEEFDLFCRKIMLDLDVEGARKEFLEQVKTLATHETQVDGIVGIFCPFDSRAEQDNKSVYALNRLNLACYLLSCVNEGTVFDTDAAGKRIPRRFREHSAAEFAALLKRKKRKFNDKYNEIESIEDAFHRLHLVPELYELDHERFGLNEYGEQATELVEIRVEEDDAEESDREERVAKREIVEEKKEGGNLLSEEGYEPFQPFEPASFPVRRMTKPEDYIKNAKALRRHHLDYLQKLKLALTEKLSRYAGRSDDNSPEILPKRRVSKSDREFRDKIKAYPYASETKKTDTRQIRTVQTLSEKAYASVLQNYMEFCAGRSVAITDIEEQCNWFVTKVRGIQAAAQQLKIMTASMLAALIVLYVPYVLIQWKTITGSTFNLTTAIVSVAAPIVVLLFALGVILARYKRKYREAWETMVKKSDEALAANAAAVHAFDQLLCSVIPSLRWVYEYKLDVDFYADCCAYAKAKLNHHVEMLKKRVRSIKVIIDDLEAETDESMVSDQPSSHTEIDYNASFCSGETNCAFYTVIDPDFLRADKETEEGRQI